MVGLYNFFEKLVAKWRDEAFEKRYGFEISHERNLIDADRLKTDSPNRAHAVGHQAVWYDIIAMLVKASRRNGVDLSRYTFVDIGSGMGKACFCASEFGFKAVRGFDFDPNLVEKAKENLTLAQRTKPMAIDFFVADAGDIVLPVGPTFLFLYNPFDDHVLEQFLHNNRALLRGDVIIGYCNDIFRYQLMQRGFTPLFRHKVVRTSLWQLVGRPE